MYFELLTINKQNILKKINEYLDSKNDKKTFNEEIKKIFSIKKTLDSILINYTINSLLIFEDEYSNVAKTETRIVSEIINSVNIRNGEKIYNYKFDVIDKPENKIVCTLTIERKDGKVDLYSYRIEEIFQKFTELSGDINKSFYETIINFINSAYKYAEHYINNVQDGKIEFEEDKFIKELIWTFVSSDSNEVAKEFNEINKK